MKTFDVCFVDLDDTIYNTKQLKEEIYSLFQPFGIGRDDFFRSYEKAANMSKFGYFHYTYEKQIEAVREAGVEVPGSILTQLENLLGNDYILPGAQDFLKFLKDCCVKLVLLTAGTKDFQAKKIKSINVSQYFNEIVQIDGGKDNIVEPYINQKKLILFINDNLRENITIKEKYPEALVITKFNPSYWTESDCEKSGMPWFKTLEDVSLYLKGL